MRLAILTKVNGLRLLKVNNVQHCFCVDAEKNIIAVDVNPNAVAWIDPIGLSLGEGPYFVVHFIGNSTITVDANDYARLVEAMAE